VLIVPVSASTVGTRAGQLIMQGSSAFDSGLGRRLVTMLPAFVVVAMGVN
jgi:manganese transport protein